MGKLTSRRNRCTPDVRYCNVTRRFRVRGGGNMKDTESIREDSEYGGFSKIATKRRKGLW